MFIQPVIFIQYGNIRCFDGRDAAEQIPEALEMVFHLTAASHDVTACRIKDSVAGAAGNIHSFQNVDVGTGHLSITDKEAGSSERSKSASYDVCMFVVNTFRFFRAGECFVVSVCIIDTFAVFFVLAAFCVAVVGVYRIF